MADIGIKVGLSLDTTQGTKEFNDWSNRTRAQLQKNPIKVNLRIDGQAYEKKIETFINANRELAQVTTYTNKVTGEQYAQVTKTASAFEQCVSAEQKLTNTNKNLSNSQQNLNTHVKHSISLFKDFTATFMKMAKFNTINMIYDGIINKMSESIKITNDFDAAMTEFKKVTDTTSLSLNDYTEQLGELGEATARTTTQMLQSATEFSKAGFTPEESARLAQVASLYQNIADAEISAGEAASFITSQIKAYKDYGIEASNATQIIDKLNEVSNNFSVSSSDIASALTKQSASLAAYGNDLNESIALVTAGTEIMTGQAGKVSRGLRTIGANITQLAQNAKEFDITVNGATKTIQLWNETGTDMLNTYDVLKQISAEWDNMTNAEKSSLAIDLAKKTQMDTFLAVLGNFEDAEKAYTTALLSEGSAWKENEKYMESIEAHQAKLKQAWEQLILSKPIEDLEKALLNAGTALLKFVNSDLAQTIIKITALVAAFGLATKAVTAFKAILTSGNFLSIFVHMLGSALAGTTSLTAAMGYLTTAMLSNPLFWGAAAVLGITAIVKGIDALIVTSEEATKALQDINDEVSDTIQNIDSLKQQISVIDEQIGKLNEKKLQISDPEQLKDLQRQTNELSRQEVILRNQLELEKLKLQTQQDQQAKAAKQAMSSKTSVTVYNSNDARVKDFEEQGLVNTFYGKTREAGVVLIDAMKRTQEEINKCREAMAGLNEESDEYKKQNERASELTAQYNEMSEALQPILENAESIIEAGKDENNLYQSMIDSLAELNKLKSESSNNSINIIEDETDSYEEESEAINDASDAYTEFLNGLEDIQSAYETLSKAADEYNENGYITASTLKKLNQLSPEYLAALQSEGNQYVVNTEKLRDLFDAEQDDAVGKLELAKDAALCKLANEYLTESTDAVTTAVTSSGDEASKAGPKYDDLATHAGNAAIKLREVHDYLVGGEGDDSSRWSEFKKQWDETSKWFDQQIENVKKSDIGLASSAKSSAGSHKDAWVEAFEEEQRQLKHSLEMNEITELEYYERLKDLNEKYFGEISGNHQKYIKEYQENEEEIYKGTKAVYDKVKDYLREAVEQGYERAINALKKEEKAVLAEIKSQIESLKKEKKSVLDGIKDQINALKKQKEQVQKYYNDQIDAIKKENEVLQEQNQLLEYQQQLQQAKAQKVMIMQDGKFQLGENESAIAQAEQNLNNYKDQLSYEQQIQQLEELRDAQVEAIEARIQSLEEYYEYMEDYYDRQIEAMEDYYDRVQEQYEKQIEALQEELDTFKEGYKKSEDLDNARLAAEVLAANEEASVWRSRLDNLATAITEYNRLLSLIGEEGAVATNGYTGSSVGYNHISEISGVDTAMSKIEGRASGDASFKGNEVALVGESPNTELVLGSRLNRSLGGGSLVNLSKGSGVVNAESTRTLAGLLNGLSNPQNVSTNHTTQQTFTFGSISLPNVTNAETFVGALRDKFNNYSIQSTTIKK